jgi:hypothetical protein
MKGLVASEKKDFISENLYHELRCLLGAATLWEIFKRSDAGFDVATAMDSAFVHSRCLFNFFTDQGSNDVSLVEFGTARYDSPIFTKWGEPLNRHVLHMSKGRNNPTNVIDGAHLKEQVVVFARRKFCGCGGHLR